MPCCYTAEAKNKGSVPIAYRPCFVMRDLFSFSVDKVEVVRLAFNGGEGRLISRLSLLFHEWLCRLAVLQGVLLNLLNPDPGASSSPCLALGEITSAWIAVGDVGRYNAWTGA